ncbi:MAG: ATP-binding protein [Candidatus Doudnabacteria bacterium]|nr:ATP-binding protein [Candidatus Doudnabacteria bacterium]
METERPKEFLRHVEWTIPTDIEQIDLYEDELEKILSDLGWGAETAYQCKLGFREGVMNAIVHGNLGLVREESNNFDQKILEAQEAPEAKTKTVRVAGDVTREKIYLTIQDQGGEKSKKLAEAFLARDPTSDSQLLKKSGRGGFLMQDAFGKEGVRYSVNDTGVKLTLEKSKETS